MVFNMENGEIAEIRLMTNGIVEIFFPGSHFQDFFFIKK